MIGHDRIAESESNGGSDSGHVHMMIEIGGRRNATIEEVRAPVDRWIANNNVIVEVVIVAVGIVQLFGQGGGPQDREDRIIRELIEIERRFGR